MKEGKRYILITGAGSGIGRGLGIALSGRNRHILAADIDEDQARETASRIEAAGNSASSLFIDVTSEETILAALNEIEPAQVDVLINNAGIQHVARLEEFPAGKWDQVVDIILKGTCQLTRAVLPQMRKSGAGRIVNIGSIHSLVASPYKSAYVAAKHALLGFSKAVALETADVDITINTICPAYVRTPLVEEQIRDQARSHGISEEEVISTIMLQPMPKKSFITIEEIAAAIEFLISDAARNITAQAIALDGGWTAQ